MGTNLIPMANFLPVKVNGTQLQVVENTSQQKISNSEFEYTTIFEPLNLLVGETTAIFEEEYIGEISVADISVGFYTEKDGFYLVTQLKNNPKKVKRLTNFIFKPTKKLIQKDFNNSEFAEHMYELLFLVKDNYYTGHFSYEELFKLSKFERKMATITHILTSIDERMLRDFMTAKLSEIKYLPCVVEFKTAGYNDYNDCQIFLTSNDCYFYAEQNTTDKNVLLSEKSVLKPTFARYEIVSKDEQVKTLLKETSDISEQSLVSVLLIKLFETIEFAYRGNIQAYLVVSMAFLTVFLKQISNDFEGTPIVALYGEAASGKSNLLRLVASAFGLDKSVLHGGMDTLVGIIQDLESYVNIPLLIDEVELQGENCIKQLIKSVYGQTGRKKYNCKNNVNTTIFYNTNYKFLYDREYINRCLCTEFNQKDFNCQEAEKFNNLQPYLSLVTKYIVENVPYSEIKALIKETEHSTILASVEDNRIKRNLAIAIAGLQMLINLINKPSEINMGKLELCLNEYIMSVSNVKSEDVGKFLSVLKELLAENNGKLKLNEDYKIMTGGVHVYTSIKETTFLENQFKQLYQKHFKNSKPLSIKAYSKLLIEHGAEKKNVYYSPNIGSRYGLFLPYDRFEELRYLADRIGCFVNSSIERPVDIDRTNLF